MSSLLNTRPHPPSGSSPRPADTPRTKQLKELRHKRLIFYEKSRTGDTSEAAAGVQNGSIVPGEDNAGSKSICGHKDTSNSSPRNVRPLYRPSAESCDSNQIINIDDLSNSSELRNGILPDPKPILQNSTNNESKENISEKNEMKTTIKKHDIPKLNLFDDDENTNNLNCGRDESPRTSLLIKLESNDDVIQDEEHLESARFHLPYSGIIDAPMFSARSEKSDQVTSQLFRNLQNSEDFFSIGELGYNNDYKDSTAVDKHESFPWNESQNFLTIDAQLGGTICSRDEDNFVSTSFDPNSLQNLLGEERYLRLISNFKESDDYEDCDENIMNSYHSNVHHDNTQLRESFISKSNDSLTFQNKHLVNGWWNIDSDDEDYVSNLSLQTHRPSDSAASPQEYTAVKQIPSPATDVCLETDNTRLGSQRNYVQNVVNTNVKCAFSAHEIYQQADQLSHRDDSLSSFSESDFIDDKNNGVQYNEQMEEYSLGNNRPGISSFYPQTVPTRLYPDLEALKMSESVEPDFCSQWLQNLKSECPSQILDDALCQVSDENMGESTENSKQPVHPPIGNHVSAENSSSGDAKLGKCVVPLQISISSPRPALNSHQTVQLKQDKMSNKLSATHSLLETSVDSTDKTVPPKGQVRSSIMFQHRSGKDLKNNDNFHTKFTENRSQQSFDKRGAFSFSSSVHNHGSMSRNLKEQLTIKMDQLDVNTVDPQPSTLSSLDSIKLSDSLLDSDKRKAPSPLPKYLRDQLTLRLSASTETLDGKPQSSNLVRNNIHASFESLDLRDSYELEHPTSKRLPSLPRALQDELNLELDSVSGTGPGSRCTTPAISPKSDIEIFEREDQLETSRSRAEIREFLEVPALPMLSNNNDDSARSENKGGQYAQANDSQFSDLNLGKEQKQNNASDQMNSSVLASILKPERDLKKSTDDIESRPAQSVDKSVVINVEAALNPEHGDDEMVLVNEDEEDDADVYQEFIEKLVADPRFRQEKPQRPWSAGLPSKSKTRNRPQSAGNVRPQSANSKVKAYVNSAPYKRHWERSSIAWSSYNAGELNTRSSLKVKGQTSIRASTSHCDIKKKKGIASVNTYAKYLEMSPRIHQGDFSVWLCLPDEVLLHIFSYLPHQDLARCAQVCSHYNRVAQDSTLWRNIQIRNSNRVCDAWLTQIGKYRPTTLSLSKVEGDQVTAEGLRDLFRQCADSLQELSVNNCNTGQMCGDIIMLHVAARCHCVTNLEVSWSNITDNGVAAISESSNSLLSVCLSGSQGITDEAVNTLTSAHGQSLQCLELFGCFGLTSKTASYIKDKCRSLTTLNLGQCWKLSDSCLSELTMNMPMIEHLDLRGCKQMKDGSVHHIMRNCPNLKSISLANCSNLTDVSLLEISTYSPKIESLDVCGCKNISDEGVRSLSSNCKSLTYLDLSSTAITYKSVSTVANYCNQQLETIKLNFCKSITEKSLMRLAKHCKKLKKIYLYGITTIRNLERIKAQNEAVWIEI